MSKQAEQSYLKMLGEAGKQHSLRKPFSDIYCGLNLASIGSLISLMPAPPGRVLDMGCGGGWTSVFYAKYGFDVVGQDISQDMIDLANENKRLNCPEEKLSFVRADYEEMDYSEVFDCVVFFDSLHHADDEFSAINSAYKALRPGGVLITHEPGEGHSTSVHSIEAMRLYGVNERDMPPELIINHGKAIGFESVSVYPMQQEIYTIFYEKPAPKVVSKAGFRLLKRLFRLKFRQSKKSSGIVVMHKPF